MAVALADGDHAHVAGPILAGPGPILRGPGPILAGPGPLIRGPGFGPIAGPRPIIGGPALIRAPAPVFAPAPAPVIVRAPAPAPIIVSAPAPAPVIVSAPAPAYGPGPLPSYAPEPVYDGPAVYNFAYGVEDAAEGLNFGHTESRDGYNTQGSYFVNLPDGRLQTVNYHADQNGYVADVSYTGNAIVPTYAPAPRPAYGPIVA